MMIMDPANQIAAVSPAMILSKMGEAFALNPASSSKLNGTKPTNRVKTTISDTMN